MSRTRFRVNPRSIVALMSRNSLLEANPKSFFSMEMNIYTLNIKQQSPGTMNFMGARDTKKVITKRKN